MPPILSLLSLLSLLLAQPVPPAPTATAASTAAPSSDVPSQDDPNQGVVAHPLPTEYEAPPAVGFEDTLCTTSSPCGAGDAVALAGPADSNFGGGGMGFEIGTEVFDASPAGLQSHLLIAIDGHFNGLGLSGAAGSGPRGELDAHGSVGLGFMGHAAFHSGFSPFVFLHPVALEIGNVAGGAIWAYQPQLEVGLFAHSAHAGSGVILSLRAGGNLFYGNGPLTLLADPGQSTAQVHWRADPLGVASLSYAQRLSATIGLHLGGELADTSDSLGSSGDRQLLRGKAYLYLRLGGLLTGPQVTVSAIGQAPSGSGYVGALPETNFTWMLGI